MSDIVNTLRARIHWLEQKLEAARQIDGPEYTPNPRIWGRIEGEIGGVKWAIDHLESGTRLKT